MKRNFQASTAKSSNPLHRRGTRRRRRLRQCSSECWRKLGHGFPARHRVGYSPPPLVEGSERLAAGLAVPGTAKPPTPPGVTEPGQWPEALFRTYGRRFRAPTCRSSPSVRTAAHGIAPDLAVVAKSRGDSVNGGEPCGLEGL